MKNSDSIISAIRDYTSARYKVQEYPALQAQFEQWRDTRPLSGVRILDSTPLFTNTLLKFIPLLAAGAELTVATQESIPFDDSLIPLLAHWGLPHVHNDATGKYDCVLDCGGVHSMLNPTFGYGELTRSGVYHYEHTAKPVILVDDSRTKAIETCLGTGEGFLRGMKQEGHTDFAGKSVVLFGYGKVGRGIAYYAAKAGAHVTVIDNAGVAVPDNYSFIERHDRTALQEAVAKAWCVVTATGIADAMKGNGAAEILRDGDQLIAAMGIEDEWGDELPRERILNNGAPLNFKLDEPTLVRYIDPSMALHNAAALELITKHLPAGLQKISLDIEAVYWKAVTACGLITQEIHDVMGEN